MSFSSLGFTKPFFLDIPSSQAFHEQSRDQDIQPQGDGFQLEESTDQESGFASGVEMFLDSPTAHNRTSSDVKERLPCFSHMVKKFDWCRRRFVNHVHCLKKHVACFRAINSVYRAPSCQTVYGFFEAKFVSKCHSLPIDCQCAA